MRTSVTRRVVLAALIAAGGVALVFGAAQLRQERSVEAEANAVAAAAANSPPSERQDQRLNALATAQSVAKSVTAALSGSPGSSSASNEVRPAFDVTRIEPSGDAVIAGRAAPGASVELLRNGKLHDRVAADKSGQFAMVPPRLPPGDYELTLRSTLPDGTQATSKDSVVVALQSNLKDRPVVALMTPDKPGVVLSKPAESKSGGQVAVEMVETEPGGKLYVSGRSPPGAALRLYLNDSYLASTTTAADGRFAFTINKGVGPGGYRVRLDEVESGSGAIRSRAEVPFNMPEATAAKGSDESPTAEFFRSPRQTTKRLSQAAGATSASAAGSPSVAAVPKVTTTVVSPGDSLWSISLAAYGTGVRYSVIYGANHTLIRNPDLIYPGQVLVLPKAAR